MMNASSKTLSLALAAALAACASGGATDGGMQAPAPSAGEAAAPAETAAAPSGGGHFTAAQADAGRTTFRSQCTECHYSSEFSDDQFKFKWSRRTAESLYDLIFTQMPESAPGSLSPEQTVGLVSYILRLNGFEEGGTELAADPAVLGAISLAAIRD